MNDKNRGLLFYGEMFFVFFRIGLFTFGGGYAMLPLIEKTIIEKKKWIQEQDLLDILSVAQSMPGAIAINAASLIGRRVRGWRGAIVCLVGCALPSVIVILTLATVLHLVQDSQILAHVFVGIRAAVTALIIVAAVRMGKKAIRDGFSLALALLIVVLVFVFGLHPLYTILGGFLLGLSLYWIRPSIYQKLAAAQKPDDSSQT